MPKMNRIFISFAIEDGWARDFLKGQANNEHSPFDFVDMSVKEPWSSDWKEKCRTKIKGCDGVIAMISKNTAAASGARWEMTCASQERIPMLGVHVSAADKGPIPDELAGCKVVEWTWPNIAAFINRL